MGFITGLLKTAGATGKLAVGGTAGRMALGGAVGGIYSAATNPYNDPNLSFMNVVRGAALGATVGGLSRLVTPAIRFGAGAPKISGMPVGIKAAAAAAGPVGRMGLGAAKWAVRHPGTVLAGAGIVGGAALLGASPYDSPAMTGSLEANYSPDAAAMNSLEMGQVAPMGTMSNGSAIRNHRMMKSTMGLTQGLHRGRHG